MNLKNLIRTMGIAAFILLAGCSRLKSPATPMPQSQTATAATMAPAIQVVLADGSSVTLAYSTVSHLPLQTLSISGKTEQSKAKLKRQTDALFALLPLTAKDPLPWAFTGPRGSGWIGFTGP